MRINLSKTPSFPQTYSSAFGPLTGGLNLRDLGYLLENNESPNMKNLMWINGLLQCRPGQRKVASIPYAPVYAAYENLYHGCAFFHAGSHIVCLQVSEPLTEPYDSDNPLVAHTVSGPYVPPNRGTFFQYQGGLYYKNVGGFFAIEFNEDGEYGQIDYPSRFFVSQGTNESGPLDVYIYSSERELFVRDTTVANLGDLNGETFLFRDRGSGYILAPGVSPNYQVPDVSGSAPETITLPEAPVADDDPDPTNCVFYGEARTYTGEASVTMLALWRVDLSNSFAHTNDALVVDYADGGLSLEEYNSWTTSLPKKVLWSVRKASDGGLLLMNFEMGRLSGEDPCYVMYQAANSVEQTPFRFRNITSEAETAENAPVIVINASPANGSGTLYQPENRLSSRKTVWYNGDGTTTVYHLPVQAVSGVGPITVGGVTTSAASIDKEAGTVTFSSAPAAGTNNVSITYSKPNDKALQAILGCKYAAVVSGGDSAQFIMLGGNETQPDAIFWNANDEYAIRPWYFPMDCYNLAGTAGDAVTGFGRQYNDTLVFSDHTVGKLTYDIQTVDGRSTPSFGYERVNSKIGCDLPWTIQQVENNVVFCNSYRGAHIVLSSSAAYENNIQELSPKINESVNDADTDIAGLLQDIADSTDDVISFDDDERYWICCNGKVYVWDYEVSTYAKPSWFYWTGISPAGMFRDERHNIYHADKAGDIHAFLPICEDNGEAIDKLYQFPTMNFGTYARLKDVTDMVLSLRSDVVSQVTIRYDTELESREDQTPVIVLPENNHTRTGRHAVQVAKRRPKCLHIRQFGLTLSNNFPGEELALVSAEVFYRFTGKER
jgi:hypothetical protein